MTCAPPRGSLPFDLDLTDFNPLLRSFDCLPNIRERILLVARNNMHFVCYLTRTCTPLDWQKIETLLTARKRR